MKKKVFNVVVCAVLVMVMMVNTVLAAPELLAASNSVTNTRVYNKTSNQYSLTMGATVSATAYFENISQYSCRGESISLSFSNTYHVSDTVQSGNLNITSGSTSTVQKTFSLYYDYNSRRYYTGAVVNGKCVINSIGQRVMSCTLGDLDTILIML